MRAFQVQTRSLFGFYFFFTGTFIKLLIFISEKCIIFSGFLPEYIARNDNGSFHTNRAELWVNLDILGHFEAKSSKSRLFGAIQGAGRLILGPPGGLEACFGASKGAGRSILGLPRGLRGLF